MLPANDVAEAADWFEKKLGFEQIFLHCEEPGGEPTYAIVRREEAEIHLFLMPVEPAASNLRCYISVQGIGELHHEYTVRNLIHPEGELQRRPWGQMEFWLRELNGAVLVFGEGAE